jgi:hypothetical protein
MRNRFWLLTLFFLGLALFLPPTAAGLAQNTMVMPGPGWQVIRAEWGAGNRWMDVTNPVRILLSGNGMVQVNNQNIGGDPAKGADKILRIQASNYQGQSRQFTFREGSSIDARQFYNYGGGIGGGSGPGWQVMRADWGAGNRRVDVTDRVRALLSGNGMVRVNNQNMGSDPAVGADKILRISARDARGQVQQFTYKEGSSIDASQFYNYGGYPSRPVRVLRRTRATQGARGRADWRSFARITGSTTAQTTSRNVCATWFGAIPWSCRSITTTWAGTLRLGRIRS